MDEDQSQQVEPQETVAPMVDETPTVGFPVMPTQKPKSGGGKLIFIILGILILIGLGVFLFARNGYEGEVTISPTPTEFISETPTPEESGTPTPTATSIDKTDIKIEIKNGTGISGEAAFLQTKLKALGYSDISTGNAESQEETVTTVTFSKTAPTSVVDEIKKTLESSYTEVTVKTSSSQSSAAVIVTGLRKGVTPKPTGTSTSTPTPTATKTPTATPSAN
jgi:hypothetical protein